MNVVLCMDRKNNRLHYKKILSIFEYSFTISDWTMKNTDLTNTNEFCFCSICLVSFFCFLSFFLAFNNDVKTTSSHLHLSGFCYLTKHTACDCRLLFIYLFRFSFIRRLAKSIVMRVCVCIELENWNHMCKIFAIHTNRQPMFLLAIIDIFSTKQKP